MTISEYVIDRIVERSAECYELEGDCETCGCAECQLNGTSNAERSATYKRGEAVLVGMLDSPYGDGQAHYFCNRHLAMFFGDDIDRCDPRSFLRQ